MQIDRSNYEEWLIDWLDGKLTDIQVKEIQLFLMQNPDLKEEFSDLEGFKDFRYSVPDESFRHKEQLKKSAGDLSSSQFEYLSVAFLENDLTPDQQSELNEIIENDNEKKLSFELIQKTRLSPPEIRFQHKKRLVRRTVAQNLYRISLVGLSAAAITTVIILNYISAPQTRILKSEKSAQSIPSDSVSHESIINIIHDTVSPLKKIGSFRYNSKDLIGHLNHSSLQQSGTPVNMPSVTNSVTGNADSPENLIDKISVHFGQELKEETLPNTIIALDTKTVIPEYNDGRSKLSRYIAKTFREKILKEKTAKDTPLKAYEIAEAGVSGINRLLGWDMSLDKKKDTRGELKSVYFSSKILKFNAPVKKSEPLP